jgi:hypothetical protein
MPTTSFGPAVDDNDDVDDDDDDDNDDDDDDDCMIVVSPSLGDELEIGDDEIMSLWAKWIWHGNISWGDGPRR